MLAGVQGQRPAIGLVACGPDAKLRKIRLYASRYRQAEQILDELRRLQAGEELRFTLNKRRVEQLIELDQALRGETLRTVRAVEALECLTSQQARQLLQVLAK